nr:cytoskeleton-associated protein 2-like [Anolis sagrei ordinatus]
MSAWPGSLRFGGSDRERAKGRPRPGRGCSAEEDAAAADRRRRLEAFLAQKGRPRPAGGRPYLKDRTNGQALASSRPGSARGPPLIQGPLPQGAIQLHPEAEPRGSKAASGNGQGPPTQSIDPQLLQATQRLPVGDSKAAGEGPPNPGSQMWVQAKNSRPLLLRTGGKKLLEDWLVSRGKCYKRPPMRPTVPKPPKAKSSLNLSFWGPLEEEEEKKKKEEEERKEQQYLANKIVDTLAECRKLAEEAGVRSGELLSHLLGICSGLPAEQILATLTRIPHVEKFAQFWVCKATLEARRGTLDVTGLYEAALFAGATPLQELQDAIACILKHVSVPSRASPVPKKEEENADPLQSPLQSPSWAKPCSAIKLQVLSLPRSSKRLPRPEVRLLTPVRRSLRIEGATASYPQMLRDHDPVVSSLDEIVAAEHGSQFLFRSNAALLMMDGGCWEQAKNLVLSGGEQQVWAPGHEPGASGHRRTNPGEKKTLNGLWK